MQTKRSGRRITSLGLLGLGVALCLVAVPARVLAQISVAEATFCLRLQGNDCAVPVVAPEVPLSRVEAGTDGVRRLHFWTSVSVSEDRNIVHVWSTADRKQPWAEPVHVAYSDKLKNLTLEILTHIRSFLADRFKAASMDSIQGVMLPLKKSPRFRTYSNIRAVPGTFTVEVRDFNGAVIAGGEARTLVIRPE